MAHLPFTGLAWTWPPSWGAAEAAQRAMPPPLLDRFTPILLPLLANSATSATS